MSDGWASPSGEPNRQGDHTGHEGYQGYGGQPPPQYGPPQGPPAYGPPQYQGPPQYHGPAHFTPMTPKPGVIPLRPLTLGDIFGGAIATIRGNPMATLGLSLIVQLIVAIPGIFSAIWLRDTALANKDSPIFDAGGIVTLAGSGVVSYLGSIVLSGLLIVVVSEAVLGRRISISETWRRVRRRIWALLGLAIVVFLAALVLVGLVVGVIALAAVASGTVLAVILGIPLGILTLAALIFFGIRLNLASAALVLEEVGVFAAFKRSWALTHTAFWRVFGITLLASIVAQFIAGIAGIPGGILTSVGMAIEGAGGAFVMTGGQLWSAVVAAAVAPFITGVTGLLYIDQRMRREGLDVTLLSAASKVDHAPR